ncbi:hypothetical protein EG878_14800 [Enterococcus faecalis]|nr:hypothetical protein EG878_14800 [Enterococcus faecalis]
MIRGKLEGRVFELRWTNGRFSGRYESNNAKAFIEETEVPIYHPIKGIGTYKITDDELVAYLILSDMAQGTPLLELLSDPPAFEQEIADADSAEEETEE